MHGSIRAVRCTACDYKKGIEMLEDLPFLATLKDFEEIDLSDLPRCPSCSALLRPNIVWFGERLADGAPDIIDDWINAGPVDLVIIVGSSLRVFPAAEFVDNARDQGARLAVVNSNLDDGPASGLDWDDWFFEGDAAESLPLILNHHQR
jgi:NAD-dependent SIR2 family protein deacetylase